MEKLLPALDVYDIAYPLSLKFVIEILKLKFNLLNMSYNIYKAYIYISRTINFGF